MSAARWLSERRPTPPAELSEAVNRALSDSAPVRSGHDCLDEQSVRDGLIAAARSVLPRAVSDGCQQRSGALDLLTLDALMTYGMEASSGSSVECETTATALLNAIGESTRTAQ